MRKPRLSKKTIQKLYDEGKAYSGKYEYELRTEWDETLKGYGEYLYCWDEENNFRSWEVPAEGIWAFQNNRKDG